MRAKARPAASVRLTFRQILETSRKASAGLLWDRAEQFSKLRHLAKSKHRARTARRCGEYKARLLSRLIRVAPDLVKVVPATDSDRLYSVRFQKRGQLHLPPRYVFGA
jgi:hypothetical protein